MGGPLGREGTKRLRKEPDCNEQADESHTLDARPTARELNRVCQYSVEGQPANTARYQILINTRSKAMAGASNQ